MQEAPEKALRCQVAGLGFAYPELVENPGPSGHTVPHRARRGVSFLAKPARAG